MWSVYVVLRFCVMHSTIYVFPLYLTYSPTSPKGLRILSSDSPGSAVAETLCRQCSRAGFNAWSGN